ncbi:phosphodiesterase [Micromonospora sp. WMMD882]|uniref:phosphodiesterase n=1 Tax=Micromonospora sp. WMMD882 TaxID=3015151 RepID=UPI00248C9F5A|nr:phosphodiesterase [Micromonospora sp. WMMD882]WBB79544.1 phosphodiesterase [Micromonospora sp. WMMD882]
MPVASGVEQVAAVLARWRDARLLHPAGRSFDGEVTIRGVTGAATGVPLLDRPGRYRATVRFSKGVPTPTGWPDVLGLGVRVHVPSDPTVGDRAGRAADTDGGDADADPRCGDAPGDGQRWTFDLLVSSSGAAPVLRCLPLPRRRFAGPYSTIMPLRAGRRRLWLAALPAPGSADPGDRLAQVTAVARTGAVRLVLAVASAFGPWRPFGEVRLGDSLDAAADAALAFDPVGNLPAGLRAVGPLARLRARSYRGSRRARGANAQSGGSTATTV